jgi:chromosome segregation ATPase
VETECKRDGGQTVCVNRVLLEQLQASHARVVADDKAKADKAKKGDAEPEAPEPAAARVAALEAQLGHFQTRCEQQKVKMEDLRTRNREREELLQGKLTAAQQRARVVLEACGVADVGAGKDPADAARELLADLHRQIERLQERVVAAEGWRDQFQNARDELSAQVGRLLQAAGVAQDVEEGRDPVEAVRSVAQAGSEAQETAGRLQEQSDRAYAERNQLVALLARLYPSGRRKTAIEGWDPEWHGCVFIDTPEGQLSWHYHDREAPLFESLPEWSVSEHPWDGHTTEEKYARVRLLWEGIDFVRATTP